ncbi:putative histidine triad (HIT) protein [Dioscorea sansibarensis]
MARPCERSKEASSGLASMAALRRLAAVSSHLRPPAQEPGSSVVPAVASSRSSGGNGCVFCEIISGESPAFKLYEDDICLCILDSYPLTFGHSLIITKSHFSSLQVTPPSVVAAMCSTVPFLSNAIMKATHCKSFNLVVNNGSAAGQVIFHTHLHIIPRKVDDQLWPSESFRRQSLEQNLETFVLVKSIKEQLSSADESTPANNSED